MRQGILPDNFIFHGAARPFGSFILKFGLERHFEEALRELKSKLESAEGER